MTRRKKKAPWRGAQPRPTINATADILPYPDSTENETRCFVCYVVCEDPEEHKQSDVHKENGGCCNLCEMSFLSKTQMKAHKASEHPADPTKKICIYCAEVFTSKKLRSQHNQSVHPVRKTVYDVDPRLMKDSLRIKNLVKTKVGAILLVRKSLQEFEIVGTAQQVDHTKLILLSELNASPVKGPESLTAFTTTRQFNEDGLVEHLKELFPQLTNGGYYDFSSDQVKKLLIEKGILSREPGAVEHYEKMFQNLINGGVLVWNTGYRFRLRDSQIEKSSTQTTDDQETSAKPDPEKSMLSDSTEPGKISVPSVSLNPSSPLSNAVVCQSESLNSTEPPIASVSELLSVNSVLQLSPQTKQCPTRPHPLQSARVDSDRSLGSQPSPTRLRKLSAPIPITTETDLRQYSSAELTSHLDSHTAPIQQSENNSSNIQYLPQSDTPAESTSIQPARHDAVTNISMTKMDSTINRTQNSISTITKHSQIPASTVHSTLKPHNLITKLSNRIPKSAKSKVHRSTDQLGLPSKSPKPIRSTVKAAKGRKPSGNSTRCKSVSNKLKQKKPVKRQSSGLSMSKVKSPKKSPPPSKSPSTNQPSRPNGSRKRSSPTKLSESSRRKASKTQSVKSKSSQSKPTNSTSPRTSPTPSSGDDSVGISMDIVDDLLGDLDGGVVNDISHSGPRLKLVNGEMVIDESSLVINNRTPVLDSFDYVRVDKDGRPIDSKPEQSSISKVRRPPLPLDEQFALLPQSIPPPEPPTVRKSSSTATVNQEQKIISNNSESVSTVTSRGCKSSMPPLESPAEQNSHYKSVVSVEERRSIIGIKRKSDSELDMSREAKRPSGVTSSVANVSDENCHDGLHAHLQLKLDSREKRISELEEHILRQNRKMNDVLEELERARERASAAETTLSHKKEVFAEQQRIISIKREHSALTARLLSKNRKTARERVRVLEARANELTDALREEQKEREEMERMNQSITKAVAVKRENCVKVSESLSELKQINAELRQNIVLVDDRIDVNFLMWQSLDISDSERFQCRQMLKENIDSAWAHNVRRDIHNFDDNFVDVFNRSQSEVYCHRDSSIFVLLDDAISASQHDTAIHRDLYSNGMFIFEKDFQKCLECFVERPTGKFLACSVIEQGDDIGADKTINWKRRPGARKVPKPKQVSEPKHDNEDDSDTDEHHVLYIVDPLSTHKLFFRYDSTGLDPPKRVRDLHARMFPESGGWQRCQWAVRHQPSEWRGGGRGEMSYENAPNLQCWLYVAEFMRVFSNLCMRADISVGELRKCLFTGEPRRFNELFNLGPHRVI
eukprot:513468_1